MQRKTKSPDPIFDSYIVAAFDLSLNHTGYCTLGVEDSLEYGLIEPEKGLSGIARLRYVRQEVLDKIDCRNPFVIMEGLSFGSRGSAVHELAGLAHMIRAELYERNIPYLIPPPKALVKFITGKGSGKKEHMLKGLLKKPFELDIDDNNIADAIGLYYLGSAILHQWKTTTKPQAEVVEKIIKANPTIDTLEYEYELTL